MNKYNWKRISNSDLCRTMFNSYIWFGGNQKQLRCFIHYLILACWREKNKFIRNFKHRKPVDFHWSTEIIMWIILAIKLLWDTNFDFPNFIYDAHSVPMPIRIFCSTLLVEKREIIYGCICPSFYAGESCAFICIVFYICTEQQKKTNEKWMFRACILWLIKMHKSGCGLIEVHSTMHSTLTIWCAISLVLFSYVSLI